MALNKSEMGMRAIVDTNVMIVANGKAPQASLSCQEECANKLLALQREGKIVLDDAWHILEEYGKNLQSSGQPGLGDAFYRWVLQNNSNPQRCERYSITTDTKRDGNFLEFPSDARLNAFDPSDRKFVALAAVSSAPIWEAVDSDYWDHQAALQENKIVVEFLCPDYFSSRTNS